MPEANIYTSNPMATPKNTLKFQYTTLPTWTKQNTPATILTPDMKKPTQGTLQHHQDGIWYFHLSRVQNRSPIPLPNLQQDIIFLIKSPQLTRGHPPFHTTTKDKITSTMRLHAMSPPRIFKTQTPRCSSE